MSEEEADNDRTLTTENVGMGLAFLGMVLFIAYGFLFWASMMMPQLFNLFSGPTHFVVVSSLCIILVVGGYILTKRKRSNKSF